MITFTVSGVARPAGSKRAIVVGNKAVVIDASSATRPWQALIADAARQAYSGPPLESALALMVTEYRCRPKGHFGKRGLNKKGRENPYPTGRPDLLKIGRAIEDALTGVLWADDAQIVYEDLFKCWANSAFVRVSVWEISEIASRTSDLAWLREREMVGA